MLDIADVATILTEAIVPHSFERQPHYLFHCVTSPEEAEQAFIETNRECLERYQTYPLCHIMSPLLRINLYPDQWNVYNDGTQSVPILSPDDKTAQEYYRASQIHPSIIISVLPRI